MNRKCFSAANRKRTHLLAAAALGALLTAVSAFGEGNELRLLDAQAEAVNRSPELKIAGAQAAEAGGASTQALSGFLPKVSAFAYHYTDVKFQTFTTSLGGQNVTIPLVLPQSSAKFSVDLPLLSVVNIEQYRSFSSASSAAEENSRWQSFVLSENIEDSFYKALASEQLAQVANENIKTLEDHYNQVQARKKGGIATKYDVLRVEVQLDEARTQKIQADDAAVIARMRLARLMGDPADKRRLKGDLPVPENLANIDELSPESALKERTDLRAIELQQRAADLADAGAKAWWAPTVGALADYEVYNNTNSDMFKSDPYRNDYDVGIYVRWNLFDGGASLGRAQQAGARFRQAEAVSEREVQKIPEDLENWRRRYRYGTALYRTSVADIQKSEESVRQAKEGFKEGVRTVSEQLDAQLDLFRSRASKIQAQLTAAAALIQLEMTVGRKLGHASN